MLIGLLVLLATLPSQADAAAPSRQVLIIHSYHSGLSWTDSIMNGIRDTFGRSNEEIQMSAEYLDARRYTDSERANRIRELLVSKLRGTTPSLVLVSDNTALEFILEKRDQLLPDTPVVFCGINNFQPSFISKYHGITGVAEDVSVVETVDMALQLHPGTSEIIVVSRTSVPADRYNRDSLVVKLPHLPSELKVTFWDDLPASELRVRLEKLGKGSVVLLIGLITGETGRQLMYGETTRFVVQYSPVPVYSLWDVYLGHGIVGGKLISGYRQGELAAEMALRVLNGESADNLSVVNPSAANRYMVDYRQLVRFNIPLSSLPASTEVVNRPHSFYDQFKDIVWATVIVVCILSALVVLLSVMVIYRRKTEHALQQSEAKYRNIFENATEGIFQTTLSGQILSANTALAKMAGYGTAQEMIDFAKIRDMYVNPDDRTKLIRTVEKKGMLQGFETELYRKDGSRFWVSINMHIVRDKEGRIQCLEGTNTDITMRKRAEKELMESRQELSDIIEFLPDATLVIDKEGRVIAWNRAMEEMTGVTAKEMLGKGNYEYAIPFYGERRPILIDLVLRPDEACERKYVDVRRKDKVLIGEAYMPALRWGEVYLLGTARTLKDSQGYVIGAIESIHDITGRRKAEDALRESEKEYRSVIENIQDIFYRSNIHGQLIMGSPSGARMFGYDSIDDMIGMPLDSLWPDSKERHQLLAKIKAEGRVNDYKAVLRRKDGSTFNAAFTTHFYYDDNGNILGTEGIIRDITERIKADEERKKLEIQLAQAQKMEAIGTMAGGIAHDFNNILTAMIGYTELAKSEEDHEMRNDCLNQVLKASERAKSLVNQILAFSRTREVERKPVQIRPIVKECIKLLRSTIPSTIEILQEIETKPSIVQADSTQIHQILINLCTNSAHAMRNTGGTLKVSLSHKHIDQEWFFLAHRLQAGWYAKLTVQDTGHGIDPAVMDRIFEPFFTTKQQGEGTGLGMSVVYGIIKSYSGAIDVASEPGKGTTVTVYLPLVESLKTASEGYPAEEVQGGHERILLVDDETALVDLGERMLRHLGYQVTTRTSSIEALELFRARHADFDLVITDMTMPNMTGAELAKRMLAIRPDMPIVLCTGYSEIMTEENARALGIRGYVMKPLTRKELGTVIHEALKPIQQPGNPV